MKRSVAYVELPPEVPVFPHKSAAMAHATRQLSGRFDHTHIDGIPCRKGIVGWAWFNGMYSPCFPRNRHWHIRQEELPQTA